MLSYKTTDLQKGILFDSEVSNLKSAYIVQRIFTLQEKLNEETLLEAWQQAVNRYEGLRAYFCDNLEELVIVDFINCPVKRHDLSRESCSEQEKQLLLDNMIYKDSQRKFDFKTPPLMRFTLVKFNEDKFYFIWSYHHVLMSGPAALKVMKEAFCLYDSFLTNDKINLPLPSTYFEQVTSLKNYENLEAKDYWRGLLEGYKGDEPLSKSNKKELTGKRQGIFHFHVGKAQFNKLKEASKAYNITESTFIYAAWAIVLENFFNCSDVCFGAVRVFPSEFSEHVGLLMNTLPIRVKSNSFLTVIDLLKSIRKQYKNFRNYITTPLSSLRKWAFIDGDRPLFNTVVDFKLASLNQNLKSQGGRWKNRELHQIIDNNHSILLEVCGEGEELSVELIYNQATFDSEFIKKIGKCFINVLGALCLSPDYRICNIELLNSNERENILDELKALTSSEHNPKAVHEIFELQVEKFPKNVALSFQGAELTYCELNRKANQLARYLLARIDRPLESRVNGCHFIALSLERGFDMLVSILAVLKIGAAYIPIDPSLPEKRLEMTLADINPSLIITHIDAQMEGFSSFGYSSINLKSEEVLKAVESLSDFNLNSAVNSSALAYVIYTSGSTGSPKGVMVSHKNVVRLFHSANDYFSFTKADVWTLFHSYTFDFSVWEIWGALFYGGKLIIPSCLETRDTFLFYKLCKVNKVSVLSQTPTAFYQFINVDSQAGFGDKLKCLRYVIFGGEKLDFYKLKQWTDKYGFSVPKLVNMYGITETTVHVTLKEISSDNITEKRSIIGRPLKDLACYVLNPHMKLLPDGCVGELFVSGGGVTQGYLNQGELTNERFLSAPFDPSKEKMTLYKTGDMVRRLPSGELEYMDRNDSQVKIHGFRIELGEVERALLELKEIDQAVVKLCAIDALKENKVIVAYYKIKTNVVAFDEGMLRAELSLRLPNYMMPKFFVRIDFLPLTANGKLDIEALPAPKKLVVDEYIGPNNDNEKQLCAIWESVLGIERVGIADDFFKIGGDSILLIQMIYEVSQKKHLPNLSFSDVLSYRTIQAILTSKLKEREVVEEGEI